MLGSDTRMKVVCVEGKLFCNLFYKIDNFRTNTVIILTADKSNAIVLACKDNILVKFVKIIIFNNYCINLLIFTINKSFN